MFTGIVEEIGKVRFVSEKRISIDAAIVLENSKLGDSISVNGVCLTITSMGKNNFEADISAETYRVSAMRELKAGSLVNLERAMIANGRFGGHIVSGHIDNTGRITKLKKNGDFYDLDIEISESDARYVVKKGSITINGISLTVANIEKNHISIAVIPHTFENTALKVSKIGDYVNIETDILSKYVEKFLSTRDNRTGISMEFLQQNGF